MSTIQDISLAPEGHQRISWVAQNMPVLNAMAGEFNSTKQGVGYAAYLIAAVPLIITSAFSLSKLQSGDFAAGLKL